MRYGEETIEQVRQAVDLVGLIGGQVQLRKVGQTWKGLCPFHDEKTPSFTVNPDRQAYHCFGCGAGGDAFRFVMETEKLSFVEAMKSLAERYGVTLPVPAEEDAAGRLYRALEDAQTFYRRALEDPETGRAARAYLSGRGLGEEILERYGVGLAPAGWDALSSRLSSRHGHGVLLEAGLVIRRERGEGVYDRFRGRITVPLRLPTGRVVGFGGRALGEEEPKYLNSPETTLYRKSRFLFGLDQARPALKARDEAVLVEGYFDVIGLAQAGIEEAVATAGTALTADQCRLLRRYVPRLLLVFDGDAAGQTAAEKALGPVVAAGLETRVASLPPGQDPDTLVRGPEGARAWQKVVAEAVSPVDFVVRRHAGDREAALRTSARLASLAEDPITARLLIEEAARKLSFDEAALGREVERIRAGGRTGPG
ncbi:MAG: DNA primase, partial [Candidatus Eiseniibacteriota bacterium]